MDFKTIILPKRAMMTLFDRSVDSHDALSAAWSLYIPVVGMDWILFTLLKLKQEKRTYLWYTTTWTQKVLGLFGLTLAVSSYFLDVSHAFRVFVLFHLGTELWTYAKKFSVANAQEEANYPILLNLGHSLNLGVLAFLALTLNLWQPLQTEDAQMSLFRIAAAFSTLQGLSLMMSEQKNVYFPFVVDEGYESEIKTPYDDTWK